MTMLLQIAIERKMVKEVEPKIGDAQPVHRTKLRTELGVFEDYLCRDFQIGYSVRPDTVKRCTSRVHSEL